MLRFIIRRIIVIIPMLFIVVSLTWMLIRLAPGNFYTTDKKLAPAIEQNIREKYGLNQPWHVQYRKVLWNIAWFDFGTSLKYEGQSVNQILWRALPVSAVLGLTAYLIALLVGITTGTLAALRQNSWIDYASMALAMLGISIPNFVLGPLLVLIFSLTLFWLPPALWDGFPSKSLILPALTLSAI
jgi:oligopeptide transport system permease protein